MLTSVFSITTALLGACGGGGGGTTSLTSNLFGGANAGATSTTASSSTTSTASTTATPTTTTTTGPTTTTTLPAGAITVLDIDSLGNAQQTNLPVTFGQVFAQGDVPTGESVTGSLDGTPLALQVDAKARHADGSLRHAVISAVLPQINPNQSKGLVLFKTSSSSGGAPANALTQLLSSGFTTSVNINIGGMIYSASADALLNSGSGVKWLSGPLVNEWLVSAPLKTAGGVEHPHLTARFAIRAYVGLNKAKVDVIIENNKTFAAAPQNFTYDVNAIVDGQMVFSKPGLTHYHHARWRKTFWWGEEPEAHIKHHTAYLIKSKAVSNYDQAIVPAESALAGLASNLTEEKIGPMRLGLLVPYMPQTGGRPDIGPLPSWSAHYLLSMDRRAKQAMLATADGAATWPIHYRDEATDYPVRLDNEINKNISTHGNLAHLGPLPVPRCATYAPALCKTMYHKTPISNPAAPMEEMTPDVAHQPSMVYLPYLVTGEHFYLEELQFWAAWNPLETSPGSRGLEKGLMKWAQVRGQAWSLRTLGQVAYITPDAHPMKAYFTQQVGYNLDFYNQTYAVGNPNQLGVYDGSGVGAFVSDSGQSAPWQDDFLTWSSGYLTELGFSAAKTFLNWKAKYPVGRMTAPGYCWIDGAVYVLQIRPSSGMPVYTTFAEAYQETKKNAVSAQTTARSDNGDPSFNSTAGSSYLAQPCNSQAQADWRTTADDNGSGIWVTGQMTGFASSPSGFPANMQPALAVSVDSEIANADLAWQVFSGRAKKPNYSTEPQWAIVPRK
ncbi:MAG TPA: hypothetical protein DHV59_11105 [Oxalobacteraceae bacterium]|nr:hypothetical protein [Oxalobacteraceae bacterium]